MINFSSKLNTLRHSEGFKTSLSVTGGNILAAGISALTFIYLSRHLGPEDFGNFSAAIALMLLCVKVLDFGLNTSLQRTIAQNPDRANVKYTALLQLKLALSLLPILIGLLAAPFIATRWLRLGSSSLVRLTLIATGISSLYEFLASLLNGLHQFHLAVLANIIQSLTRFCLLLLIVAAGSLTAFNATLLYVISPLIAISFIVTKLKFTQFHHGLLLTRELLPIGRLAKFIGIGVLANSMAENFDIILVKYFLNPFETGLYAAASKISYFITFISLSILVVLSVRVARYQHKKDLQMYLRKARYFSVFSLAVIGICVPFAGVLLEITSGSAYQDATLGLQFLLVAAAFAIATTPFYALFYRLNQPRFYSLYGFLLLGSLLLGDISLIPRYGIVGAGISQVLMRFVLFVFTIWYSRIHYSRELKHL